MADGTMYSSHTPLEDVLRRAMKRAELVLGYEHVCRPKGCAHKERANDAALRRCPKDGMKLWPKAQLRPIRFHDLRHTTASLLMMAGANPAAVQRILRHQDPRITTEVYGHLAPDYLRAEVDRLRFHASEETEIRGAEASESGPLGPPVVHEGSEGRFVRDPGIENTPKISAKLLARHRGFEPLTYGSGVGRPPLGARSRKSQIGGNVRSRTKGKIQESHPLAGFSSPLVTPLLQGSAPLRVIKGGGDRLLSVRQVAARLNVSTATVYALVARGDLPHLRIANAIRVAPRALWTFIEKQRGAAVSTSGSTWSRTHSAKDNRPSTEATSNQGEPRHE
jgi:excisionase family DNA binding protein